MGTLRPSEVQTVRGPSTPNLMESTLAQESGAATGRPQANPNPHATPNRHGGTGAENATVTLSSAHLRTN
ncbi:hypothetical protein GCM10009642_10340 [Nocardiopsis metallicus]